MIFLQKIFRSDYNTAATVIGSFGISLGTVVMTPVSVYVTDNFGFRNRFRVAGKIFARWYNARPGLNNIFSLDASSYDLASSSFVGATI